ncbi:MAG: PD-(D/E)XK nuclease family protein, partial [Candidatus Omnitrophota bacterium]
FQLPLYYYFVSSQFPGRKINAQLYSLRTLEEKSFISDADSRHGDEIVRICMDSLAVLLDELFDPEITFEHARDQRRCGYCPFTIICR